MNSSPNSSLSLSKADLSKADLSKALCYRWDISGKDPVDQLRRRARQDQYITRALLDAQRRAQENTRFSHRAEKAFLRQMVRLGLRARPTAHKAAFDYIIEDTAGRRIKVELKAATFTRRAGRPQYGRYKADVPARQRAAADLVVFGCRNGYWHWFVIPIGQIEAGSLEITRPNPADYRGKYCRYLEAWNLLQAALGRARPAPRQLELEKITDEH